MMNIIVIIIIIKYIQINLPTNQRDMIFFSSFYIALSFLVALLRKKKLMSPHDINLLLFRFRDFIHKNLFQIKTRHFHI